MPEIVFLPLALAAGLPAGVAYPGARRTEQFTRPSVGRRRGCGSARPGHPFVSLQFPKAPERTGQHEQAQQDHRCRPEREVEPGLVPARLPGDRRGGLRRPGDDGGRHQEDERGGDTHPAAARCGAAEISPHPAS